ncbi:hypothetical protein JZ751_023561 [Albula glossodonta]|uniref:LIM zinc-binding domain-containing protein n=1 Tax=Albula glossodonta TaxID=121402 RepID=A0A8T2NHD6_9TELE|nr:hypothetical protein JZ751_023561 [Albula glossodonta]
MTNKGSHPWSEGILEESKGELACQDLLMDRLHSLVLPVSLGEGGPDLHASHRSDQAGHQGRRGDRFSTAKMTERYDCHYCKESLFGKKYVLREDNPYCIKCYESLYSNTCEECKKPIGCNSRDLSYKDRHWHEDCFHCFQCRRSLVDKPFSTKDEQLLCTECYSNEYSSKCHECKKIIMPGSKKMEHKGNSWHETCFTCQRCQQPIGTKSFIPKDGHNYCVPCYEKQFAMQCIHCKKFPSSLTLLCLVLPLSPAPRPYTDPKPITTGGVTYHDQPWHKDCFLCTGCKQQLTGQRFTSRLGGSKYISFEERQWHNDCFNCKKCSVSLVGRGFLTERDDILCPECGKDI